MTLIVHCDASSKNGYSAWCHKPEHGKPTAGVIQTMNTAAVETLAVIKAIEKYGQGQRILIISDCLITVHIIQQYKYYKYSEPPNPTLYHTMRDKLRGMLKVYTVNAEWIASKDLHPTHQIVDQLSRDVVNEYLKGIV